MYYSIDDPYTYPKSPVLRNLADIRQLPHLEVFEANMVLRRMIELSYRPIEGLFDCSRLRAIHRHLFQDVYAWAGEFRTVNMGRSGGILFAHAGQIEPYLTTVFQQLNREQCLRGATIEEFTERAAHFLGEINAVHPFREGNGRTQREFIRELADQAGFEISWDRIERDQLYEASEVSFVRGDNKPLTKLMRSGVRIKGG